MTPSVGTCRIYGKINKSRKGKKKETLKAAMREIYNK